MPLFKLTIKYGPLRWEKCLEARDGAEIERYVSQLGEGCEDGPEIPARTWREISVWWDPIQPAAWFTEWRRV